MFTEKEFLSEGSILRGRWYAAQYGPVSPCIVMSHGTSATVPMCLSEYATEFQKKGFNVFETFLLFCYGLIPECANFYVKI